MTAPGDPVGDTLHGEGGNDTFHVRDGEVDNVDCGAGFDIVIADRVDNVAGDCERTRRNDPAAREDRAGELAAGPARRIAARAADRPNGRSYGGPGRPGPPLYVGARPVH